MLATRLAVVFAALVAVPAVWWFTLPAGTDRSLVKPSVRAYVARFARWICARPVLWAMSWPHMLERFVRGDAPESAPHTVVWRDGPAELRRYSESPGPVVLIVHALVSDAAILDLTPQRSLVRHLREQGFDVFLLDWGRASRAQRDDGFEQYAARLLEAERQTLTAAGVKEFHLVGYCAGAMLSLMRLASQPAEHVRTFTALAPPVDMDVPVTGGMGVVLSAKSLKPVVALDHRGCVPGQLIRESFHILRPKVLASMRALISNRHDAHFVREFKALSRWTWNQPPVPGALFFDLVELFRSNALFQGTMALLGSPVDLRNVTTPTLLAVSGRDHIVPLGSSLALQNRIGGRLETLICQTGHVSMITGDTGRATMWPRLVEWLRENTPQPAAAKKPRSTAKKKRTPRRRSQPVEPSQPARPRGR
ncbi:MAG TPA: alpha/beta fold hydrolase [Actinomycetota bacterium]